MRGGIGYALGANGCDPNDFGNFRFAICKFRKLRLRQPLARDRKKALGRGVAAHRQQRAFGLVVRRMKGKRVGAGEGLDILGGAAERMSVGMGRAISKQHQAARSDAARLVEIALQSGQRVTLRLLDFGVGERGQERDLEQRIERRRRQSEGNGEAERRLVHVGVDREMRAHPFDQRVDRVGVAKLRAAAQELDGK